MKLRTRFTAMALGALLCTGSLAGCGPAADQVEDNGSVTGTAAVSDSEYPNLEAVNVSDYLTAQDISEFIPKECNLSGTKEDGTPWTIAWLDSDASDESMAYMDKCMKDVAKESGCEVISYDAQSDPQKQVDHVNNAINQGVDAIIINPVDTTSTISAMKKAMDSDILVIDVQNPVDDETAYDYYEGPDDMLAGQLAASMLIEACPDGGKVCMIEGMPGSAAEIKRKTSFMGVIQNYDQFDVVDIQACNNWSTAEAMNIMESDLAKYDDIVGVFTHFDLATLTAIQAAENLDRADGIKFVSVDGTQGALDKISEGGCFTGTAFQDFTLNSQVQMYMALAVLNGDGDKIEKYVMPNYVAATVDNASTLTAGWG
ncbi:MAG: sugar ABC transporter substrate-binding protein [Eubacteriales bacterium]|nr:sugar ABC transporter substrate-binding protein [Eubacteriales bacterium]